MKKIFRINVLISYFEGVNIYQYRQPILNILTNLAWLYRLEYAISTDHDFGLDSGSTDLIYFRSTEHTHLSRKELDSLIANVFKHEILLFCAGVDVYRQLYKVLPQYPFPAAYCKPLNYPYLEHHNGKESALCILGEDLPFSPDEDNNSDLLLS